MCVLTNIGRLRIGYRGTLDDFVVMVNVDHPMIDNDLENRRVENFRLWRFLFNVNNYVLYNERNMTSELNSMNILYSDFCFGYLWCSV